MSLKSRRFWLAVIVAVAVTVALAIGVPYTRHWLERRSPVPAVDAEVAALIDQLMDVADDGPGAHSTAWASGFIAVDEEPHFLVGVLGSQKPIVHPAMRELVRMGLRALPDLMNHLSDSRKTRQTVKTMRYGQTHGSFGFMGMWHSDEYDPRYPDAAKQPGGVNARPQNNVTEYTVQVGDLCYVAIGQIVNRHLAVLRYQPTACLMINSPVRTPALADAVRKDWSGLTAEQHRDSLIEDVHADGTRYDTPAALQRLYFYYPDAADPVALKLLRLPRHDRDQAYLLEGLVGIQSEKLDTAVREVFRSIDPQRYAGSDKVYADDLATACMDRLIGKGLDAELQRYCETRIRELEQKERDHYEERALQGLRERLQRIQEPKDGP
jgi:hypothetical protein